MDPGSGVRKMRHAPGIRRVSRAECPYWSAACRDELADLWRLSMPSWARMSRVPADSKQGSAWRGGHFVPFEEPELYAEELRVLPPVPGGDGLRRRSAV